MTPIHYSPLEGNKLIADFMGVKIGVLRPDKKSTLLEGSLLYNSSWDWLMPVVEKIEKEHAHVRIQVGICAINRKFMDAKDFAKKNGIALGEVLPITEHNNSTFIGNAWNAVVDFIKYYNEQNPKS